MENYLLALRSLTYAQKAQEILNRVKIPSRLMRTPSEVSPKGCSHSLRVTSGNICGAVLQLRGEGVKIEKAFATSDGICYIEVEV